MSGLQQLGNGMMLMPAKQGHCQVCAVKHPPEQPHNAQSLTYQVRFKALHGRDATWADALAHCLSAEIKSHWKRCLKEKGAWTQPKRGVAVIAEPVDENGDPKK